MGSAALTFTASYVLYGVVFLLSGGGVYDVRGYYWTTSWPDEDWTKCKSDYECELWATYVVKSDKHECCDGECRETCLSDACVYLVGGGGGGVGRGLFVLENRPHYPQ